MAESAAEERVDRTVGSGSPHTPLDRLGAPLMRLPRTSLLGRIAGPHAPRVVLLEAPTGYGKSWLIRRAAAPGVLRLRGELGPLAGTAGDEPSPGSTVIIDDAHLLDADSVARLVDRIEDADELQ